MSKSTRALLLVVVVVALGALAHFMMTVADTMAWVSPEGVEGGHGANLAVILIGGFVLIAAGLVWITRGDD